MMFIFSLFLQFHLDASSFMDLIINTSFSSHPEDLSLDILVMIFLMRKKKKMQFARTTTTSTISENEYPYKEKKKDKQEILNLISIQIDKLHFIFMRDVLP